MVFAASPQALRFAINNGPAEMKYACIAALKRNNRLSAAISDTGC